MIYFDQMVPVSIHFMGIKGSGMSSCAQIAKARGFTVTGCDLSLHGHSADHLKEVDLLCVSPAVYYLNNSHPEVEEARRRNILIKWQDFMGTYLMKDKFVICIAGTHGKSTTTALSGLLLEKAGQDPTVEVGAQVKEWHKNVRLGQSKYFVCEADEFHDNFSTFRPNILILTLVEFDHPEYFGNIKNMLDTYQRLIQRIKPGGVLIYNSDSPYCLQLINQVTNNQLTIISYSLSDFPQNLKLSQPGNHNKLNALAVIKLGQFLKIPEQTIHNTLTSFQGLSRRLDLLGEKNGVKVYDDYANHPSSFSATLQALRELYPKNRIWAVIEPHTFSRLKTLLSDLPDSLKEADEIIISKIYPSRESDPGNFSGADIAKAIPNSKYIPEFSDIRKHLTSNIQDQNIILVMGSGDSYKLSRQILDSL